jgi:hypothetical protein
MNFNRQCLQVFLATLVAGHLFMAISSLARAQQGDEPATEAETSPVGATAVPADTLADTQADTTLQKQGWLFVMPVLAYTPETRFIGGISGGRYYRLDDDPDSRPSTATPTVLYTANKQTIIWLPVDIYWHQDTKHAMGVLAYSNYPDKFFGIGNNTSESLEEDYTARTFNVGATLQKMMLPNFYFGVTYNYTYSKMVAVEPGGLLDTGLIPGSEGGTLSSLGLKADFDSRNDIFFPSGGTYLTFAASVSDRALGSDFNYTRFDLNLRQYLGFLGQNVLAWQGWITTTSGIPPFQTMPQLSLRGYFEGRYRDLNQILFQAEYRRMVWKRVGVALFAGAGQVAPEVREFRFEDFWSAYGFGLRFQVGGQERINIRIDYGFGENDSGTYFMIGEAF